MAVALLCAIAGLALRTPGTIGGVTLARHQLIPQLSGSSWQLSVTIDSEASNARGEAAQVLLRGMELKLTADPLPLSFPKEPLLGAPETSFKLAVGGAATFVGRDGVQSVSLDPLGAWSVTQEGDSQPQLCFWLQTEGFRTGDVDFPGRLCCSARLLELSEEGALQRERVTLATESDALTRQVEREYAQSEVDDSTSPFYGLVRTRELLSWWRADVDLKTRLRRLDSKRTALDRTLELYANASPITSGSDFGIASSGLVVRSSMRSSPRPWGAALGHFGLEFGPTEYEHPAAAGSFRLRPSSPSDGPAA